MITAKKLKSPKMSGTTTSRDVESLINQGRAEGEDRLRQAGLLLEEIDIDQIDEEHFVRDRIAHDEDAFHELRSSIYASGQKTPIEVTVISDPDEPLRYGLVSGWRRLRAIREIFCETRDPGFATINARVLQHDVSSALVALAIENEVRKGISPFERALFIRRTVEAGAFASVDQAILSMYGQASAAKQSKIRTLVRLADFIGAIIIHPDCITEQIGLRLVKYFDAGAGDLKARKMLEEAPKDRTKSEELALLRKYLSDAKPLYDRQTAHDRKGRGRPKVKRFVARHMLNERAVQFVGGRLQSPCRLIASNDGAFRLTFEDGTDLPEEAATVVLEDIANALSKGAAK